MVIAVLAWTAGRPATSLAQSFNCAKASTPVERFICADPALAAVDGALGAEIKKALGAAPANRQALLADARRWLKERDRRCPVPSGALTATDVSGAGACLKAIYRERLAELRSVPANSPATAKAPVGNTVICERLLRDYRTLLEAGSQTPGRSASDAASPLELLAAAKGAPSTIAKLTIAKPVVEFDKYSQAKAEEWAQKQPQPFVFSSSVLKQLEELNGVYQIDQLPGVNYFAASAVQGTALCYAQAYFRVKDGQTESAEAPSGWDDGESNGCGVWRLFGAIGETRAAFEEAREDTPALTSSVMATPWERDHFGAACSITLVFAPRFDPHATINSWDQSCDGADCEDLWQAALTLVQQAHKDPDGAAKSAIARLTPAQGKDYEILKSLAGRDSAANGEHPSEPAKDAASLLDRAPLVLPLVHNGQLYLASIGHWTIGWRVSSDWSVKLERLQDGRLASRATFAIGMTRGRLVKATVK